MNLTMVRYEALTLNGLRFNIAFAGPDDGPPVLLVHGFPDDHTIWRHQIPALAAAGYRVIAPDMRGCGESDMAPMRSDYRRELLVADLVALLDHLHLAQVRLVAHDWGAVIGWHLAIAHPEHVERYLALSVGHPHCYAHGGLKQKLIGWYAIFFFLFRDAGAWLLKQGDWWLFRTAVNLRDEWPQTKARLARPGRLIAGMNYYIANISLLWSKPAPVNVPVMGVWSAGDRFLVERQMSESGSFVTKRWRYHKLEGAYHWLQVDRPEEANRLMLDYLGSSAEH
jgi:pimeloyl-ACP methyl ester carboxylesterase